MAWMFVRDRACPVCGREMKIRGAHYACETVGDKEEEAVNISYYCDGTNGSHRVDLIIRQGGDAMVTTAVDETVEDEYYEDEYCEDERENGNREEKRK